MSQSVVPQQSALVVDPRVHFQDSNLYLIAKGAQEVSYQRFTSNSSTSTSSQAFQCNPPSAQVGIDRRVMVRHYVQWTFTGADQGSALLELGSNDAPQSYPISRCLDSISMQINQGQVTQNYGDYISAQLRYKNPRDVMQDGLLSLCPSMMDQFQELSDWTTLGSGRNPLAAYGEVDSQASRGAFPVTVVSNTNTSAVVRAVITEPLFMSPFTWDADEHMALAGVSSMQLTLNYSDLSKTWSHSSAGKTISTLSVAFYQAPEILFTYLTPDPAVRQEAIPRSLSYPYFNTTRYPQPGVSLAAAASSQVTFNNIQLQSIPSAIYIFARQQNADLTYTSSDSFLGITQVQLTFNNKQNMLSNATQQDLYHIARKNGCELSWPQWSKYVGSVLKLVPGEDFGLGAGMAPGLVGSFNLLATVTFENTGSQTKTFTPYLCVVQDGVFSVMDGQSISQIAGALTQRDILDAPMRPGVGYHEFRDLGYLGGSLHSAGGLASAGLGSAGALSSAGAKRGAGIMSRSDLVKMRDY